MTALIVGGDRLGNIPDVLKEQGIEDYIHWSGRKKGMRKMSVPCNVDMVIVLYDFIEHRLTEIIKEQTKTMNIPCVFSKRASSDLVRKLENCMHCGRCNA